MFGPALKAVANACVNILVFESLECLLCGTPQGGNNFNRINGLYQGAENGCLITTSGTDFEDTIGWLGIDGLGHVSDDEW